jgi:hypothetical protein
MRFGSFRALLDSPTDESALVVVDNCEHVLDAASEAIAALLDACHSPTVVATSRSPLGVAGESVVVLGPLGLPGDDGDERRSPAVQLFLQRARDSGAVVPDSEIAAVSRVPRSTPHRWRRTSPIDGHAADPSDDQAAANRTPGTRRAPRGVGADRRLLPVPTRTADRMVDRRAGIVTHRDQTAPGLQIQVVRFG